MVLGSLVIGLIADTKQADGGTAARRSSRSRPWASGADTPT